MCTAISIGANGDWQKGCSHHKRHSNESPPIARHLDRALPLSPSAPVGAPQDPVPMDWPYFFVTSMTYGASEMRSGMKGLEEC